MSFLELLVDMKVTLVRQFGWSLYDIDQTDIASLLRFINRMNKSESGAGSNPKSIRTYCDQVPGL